MIKLFIGGKGSGKTKTLIELVNKAVEDSKVTLFASKRVISSYTILHIRQDS